MDRTGKMTAFVKVVESGSFVGAARQLRLSSTMVSRHVRELEERLGVKLLHRTTRRVGLTEAGALFYQRCSALLAELDELEGATSQFQTTPRGILRVSSPLAFGSVRIAAVLAEFADLCPEVTVDLTLTDRTVDLVEEGFDIAVIVGDIPDSSCMTRLLRTTGTILCGAPEYLSRKGIPQAPEDLASHNCIGHAMPAYAKTWTFAGPDGRAHAVKVSGNLRTNSVAAQLTAAVHGQGLILVPGYAVADALASGRLVALLGTYTGPELPIRLVYPPGRFLAPKVRAFVDFVVARLGRADKPPAHRGDGGCLSRPAAVEEQPGA